VCQRHVCNLLRCKQWREIYLGTLARDSHGQEATTKVFRTTQYSVEWWQRHAENLWSNSRGAHSVLDWPLSYQLNLFSVVLLLEEGQGPLLNFNFVLPNLSQQTNIFRCPEEMKEQSKLKLQYEKRTVHQWFKLICTVKLSPHCLSSVVVVIC